MVLLIVIIVQKEIIKGIAREKFLIHILGCGYCFLDIFYVYFYGNHSPDVPAIREETKNVGLKCLPGRLLAIVFQYTNNGVNFFPVINLLPDGAFSVRETHPLHCGFIENEGVFISGEFTGKISTCYKFQIKQISKIIVDPDDLIVFALADILAKPHNSAIIPINLSSRNFGYMANF